MFPEHLRDSILISELSLPDENLRNNVIASTHRPNKLADALFGRTHQLYKEHIIDGHQLYILDKELKGFVDMIGGCERIKTTPIPFSFSMFIKKFLFIYSLTLPVSFAWQFGYWTTPIVILTFYFLVDILSCHLSLLKYVQCIAFICYLYILVSIQYLSLRL